MKRHVQRWWVRRASRERWLVILVLVSAVVAAIDVVLLAPQRAESRKLARDVEAARTHLQQLQTLATQQANDSENELRQRRLSLQQRSVRAMEVIGRAQIDLIAPRDMTKQLEAILVRHPALRIMGMNTVSPKPLVENASAAAGIYQHGLEMIIEGPYLDLLGYLDALERAPYHVYWRELDMKVGTTGMPVTRLVFFTLSREQAWLRL